MILWRQLLFSEGPWFEHGEGQTTLLHKLAPISLSKSVVYIIPCDHVVSGTLCFGGAAQNHPNIHTNRPKFNKCTSLLIQGQLKSESQTLFNTKMPDNVNSLMLLKVTGLTESLAALLAAIRSFPSVNPLVFLQVPSVTEASPTVQAAVGFLPCVTALVDSKIPDPAERLPAQDAAVALLTPKQRPILSPGVLDQLWVTCEGKRVHKGV